MPSVAILFGSMQGKTVKPGQVDIPGVVRYAHSCCQTQLGGVLQRPSTFTFGRRLNLLVSQCVNAAAFGHGCR